LRKLIASLFAVAMLATSLVGVAGANNGRDNNYSPGNFDNCTGVNNQGSDHSDNRNYYPGSAYHACD